MGLPRTKRRSFLVLGLVLSCFLALLPQTSFAVNMAFTYDAAGRLLTAQYGDGQRVAYTYDDVGNMTQQVASGSGGGGLTAPWLLLLLENAQELTSYSSILNN